MTNPGDNSETNPEAPTNASKSLRIRFKVPSKSRETTPEQATLPNFEFEEAKIDSAPPDNAQEKKNGSGAHVAASAVENGQGGSDMVASTPMTTEKLELPKSSFQPSNSVVAENRKRQAPPPAQNGDELSLSASRPIRRRKANPRALPTRKHNLQSSTTPTYRENPVKPSLADRKAYQKATSTSTTAPAQGKMLHFQALLRDQELKVALMRTGADKPTDSRPAATAPTLFKTFSSPARTQKPTIPPQRQSSKASVSNVVDKSDAVDNLGLLASTETLGPSPNHKEDPKESPNRTHNGSGILDDLGLLVSTETLGTPDMNSDIEVEATQDAVGCMAKLPEDSTAFRHESWKKLQEVDDSSAEKRAAASKAAKQALKKATAKFAEIRVEAHRAATRRKIRQTKASKRLAQKKKAAAASAAVAQATIKEPPTKKTPPPAKKAPPKLQSIATKLPTKPTPSKVQATKAPTPQLPIAAQLPFGMPPAKKAPPKLQSIAPKLPTKPTPSKVQATKAPTPQVSIAAQMPLGMPFVQLLVPTQQLGSPQLRMPPVPIVPSPHVLAGLHLAAQTAQLPPSQVQLPIPAQASPVQLRATSPAPPIVKPPPVPTRLPVPVVQHKHAIGALTNPTASNKQQQVQLAPTQQQAQPERAPPEQQRRRQQHDPQPQRPQQQTPARSPGPVVPPSANDKSKEEVPALPKVTTESIRDAIPADASSIVHVMDRRVNLDAQAPDASNYSLLRSWVQDDPYRQIPPAGSNIFEHISLPSYKRDNEVVPDIAKRDEKQSTTERTCNLLSEMKSGEKPHSSTNTLRDELVSRGKRIRREKRRRDKAWMEASRANLKSIGIDLPVT